MPATPIFQKHCFFKKCPKNLTNFRKVKIFFSFLLQFYRAFQWYIVCFHSLNGLGCTNQNVNQEIRGCISFIRRLYLGQELSSIPTETRCTSNGSTDIFETTLFYFEIKDKVFLFWIRFEWLLFQQDYQTGKRISTADNCMRKLQKTED